jgi:hypothetical protein
VWRSSVTGGDCIFNEPTVTLTFYDEDENTVTQGVCPSPCTQPTFNFPLETQQRNITDFSHPSGAAGWVNMAFFNASGGDFFDQAWVDYSFEGAIALETILVPARSSIRRPATRWATRPSPRPSSRSSRRSRPERGRSFRFQWWAGLRPRPLFSGLEGWPRSARRSDFQFLLRFLKVGLDGEDEIGSQNQVKSAPAKPLPEGSCAHDPSVSARLTIALLVSALGVPRNAAAQNCAILGTQSTTLPSGSGTLTPNGEMVLGANYLYVGTQWGFVRAPLTTPANPSPYSKVVVGKEGGSQEGIIPIMCDCHQGWNVMDVAEGSDGTARLVGDWQPFVQGGNPPPPPNSHFSGLPAQLAQATGSGNLGFGQQINLSDRVPGGARVAAIYIPGSNPPASAKFYAYFPVKSGDVWKAT